MGKAVVFVCLLLSMVLQLNGVSTLKKSGPTAEGKEPEEKETTKAESTGHVDPDVNSHSGVTGPTGFRGRLLVVPMDGSHWFSVKAVAQEMGRRGHQVTVVMPEFSLRIGPGKHYSSVVYPVPYGQEMVDIVFDKTKENILPSTKPFFEEISTKIEDFRNASAFILATAESLLFNTSLVSYLSEQHFDAMLTDPFIPTGSILARKLGIPTVNLLRGIPFSIDHRATACPSPPSYVPRIFTLYPDKMNFKQRVINTLMSVVEELIGKIFLWPFDQVASKFLGEDTSVADILADSAIWLLRYDFTTEFARPLMPNMVLVGGINCNIRNPLPEDLEAWVSTGHHGFVVFTLGSLVSSMPEELTVIFLEAFRQIPQKVLWRHSGPYPDNIPENVKMLKWLPQNDLLAHHGVRAFITHGGTHGLYEGLCHAVPMLMLPVTHEQPDNAHRVARRGVGVVLDIQTITVESLLQGLNDVINDIRYKDSVVKLSALHKDRPMDPLDLSVFWTEFVMRHKGAGHLRVAAHDLNRFQYHSLDVLVLLVTVLLVIFIVTVKCMKQCFRRIRSKSKKD